ncbi:MAG: molybdenum ABC transporter ATP-binding protein [Rhodospirillales bacterium RIFCSPLOWO2_12_FULL_58_28]|nr:MAG: molybdenum ABC transporter ATP-binding protein [Rhodospirillales bacterium RIFCSPLOWO2_02_FULL_58_16]OHC77108.1 MAG: molybdenum ABC transporter ATP-binding protein [Rhodospirillales bacterium RIFCSPLOWO2_12_FULL_58_28]
MLEIDVHRRFGDFNLEVNFTAKTGLTALFGRSGSGKTSLVNMLAGLERPDRGRIAVGGHLLFDSASGVDVATERRRLGYVFQEPRLFPHMSVSSNLTYGMRLAPPEDRHQDFDQIVSLLDLRPLLDRRPGLLSGGEKQRVAIGRALLAGPRLLLMDEPLASLDAPRKNEILPLIERLRDELGLPIVYVSHHLEEVIRLADAMVILSDGKVVAAGGVEDIMSRLDLHPFTGRHESGAVFAAVVVGRDEAFGLTHLSFAGNRLLAPRLDLPVGDSLRVRIRARDVSLILEAPVGASVLNVFKGEIKEINADQGPQAEVLLDIGVPLIARITRKSVHELNLKPGTAVYAMVKAVAIDRHSLGGRGLTEVRR